VTTLATERKSADVRREEILEAAMKEFAYGGLHGTSTEKIAARAGISQPYLFRLFGTKKELFIASSRRCFARVLATRDRSLRNRGRGAGRKTPISSR
jgi:AcrR family transcriptional regulator